MKRAIFTIPCLFAGLILPLSAWAYAPREDVIWARVASAPITLDGVLNEPSWDQAETKYIYFREDNGIPGSGFKFEGGKVPIDSTRATLKFLAYEDTLYLGAVVPDQSIGGSTIFNRFDALLMSIKDHSDPGAPKPPAEYFYTWWQPDSTQHDPQPPGAEPIFVGRWANTPWGSPREDYQIANWNAVTMVNGLSNDDNMPDESYTVEMKFVFDPDSLGYDLTQPGGDVIEWNISIYDCDWFWPIDVSKFSANRVWWQSPWGNAAWYNEVQVHVRPDVTVSSGPVPEVGPELTILESDYPPPVIDGQLTEPIWGTGTPHTFDIRFDDDALRQTYEGVGPYRAGQYQPTVNDTLAYVADGGDATVQIFFKDNILYFGFDVRDIAVQYNADFNLWDGFLVTINDRAERGPDQELLGRRLSFQVADDGSASPEDYLNTMVTDGDAQVAIHLNPGTDIHRNDQYDNGYTAELALDLTALGYPDGLGDGALFLGVTLLDGDSWDPDTDSYGTRTWWYRQYEGECCPVWAHLHPTGSTGIEPGEEAPGNGFILAGSYPNPSRSQRIQYLLPEPSLVSLRVFDISGRLVAEKKLGVQEAGQHAIPFEGGALASGLYLYRLTMANPESGTVRAKLTGRMVLVD